MILRAKTVAKSLKNYCHSGFDYIDNTVILFAITKQAPRTVHNIQYNMTISTIIYMNIGMNIFTQNQISWKETIINLQLAFTSQGKILMNKHVCWSIQVYNMTSRLAQRGPIFFKHLLWLPMFTRTTPIAGTWNIKRVTGTWKTWEW